MIIKMPPVLAYHTAITAKIMAKKVQMIPHPERDNKVI